MEGLNFEELLEQDFPKGRTARSKPVKRKWREIEAIKDRQRLQKELMDMDIGFDDLDKLEY
ncbi:DUF3545 family protein [Vibrio europaeus]|jgi:hypothetical protein|uniref:DUF3545 domain-containing protein n=3 Tax=Vibrio oreintalis group TaxID=1891919 RepID=F9T601_9VIBR|nr:MULTISPECIES: DUF3545 family protein [Vibrio oreintalis group]AIW14944.1 hypothetical protein IX91_12255 [Vibrio tubiashii ATCC 19109]EGU54840.1 hypothetical protein VITU9109_06505 [Vibrio tubiashii ATCC 19109]EIF05572.1 hypothetical protein VT1337_03320 [Vibrio tubiashii NCIMB 1337 = ATCC 19106]MCG9574920.1 DUF3545 family protein [Vibrio tubiashii]MCG9581622.1 DUF3545 family protein [Vibrio tubiashii]